MIIWFYITLKRRKILKIRFTVFPPTLPGLAVRWKHGGVTLFSRGTYWTHKETLQQRHWLLCKAQCPAGRWGLDGWLQVTCLHGVEHPHGSKYRSRSLLNRGGNAGGSIYLALWGEGYCYSRTKWAKLRGMSAFKLVHAQYGQFCHINLLPRCKFCCVLRSSDTDL